MLQLPQIDARVVRLRELTMGLAKEVTAWKAVESPLSPLERRQYLGGCTLDAARVVLAGVVKRLQKGPPPGTVA